MTAILQFWLLGDPTSEPLGFFLGWFLAATVSGPVTTDVPATVLRDHPRCTLVLDRAAAGDLSGPVVTGQVGAPGRGR